MLRRWCRHLPWPAFAAMAFCALLSPAHAATQELDLAARLDQTESLRTADHSRFAQQLRELREHAVTMAPELYWRLRYLEAWEASFQADYSNAEPRFLDVIDHSGNPALVTKATAVLMGDMARNKRYGEAFELANRLVAELPRAQDRLARFMALSYLSQLLRSAGQYDLAAQYAHDMAQDLPTSETSCKPMTILLTALYEGRKIASASPQLQQGVEACEAAGESVFTNTILLTKGSLYLDENQPEKALALVQRILPSILAGQYYSNTLAAHAEMAEAYWQLGDEASARKEALATIALSDPDDLNETLRDTYLLLYRLDKKRGDVVSALAHHEHYVAQDVGYLDDVRARALAYAVAQQHVLAQKLETEKLSRQNNILRLQRALDTKAVETGRLYIALLLVILVSAVFGLLRLKRSQLRFKKLSSMDGLTGILNHQHFIGAADRAVRQLEKKSGAACLIFIDLDHFKQVNDTHGHATGDAVLRRTVAICKQHLRPTDLFGRLGGEEFAILLLDCSRDQGLVVANRIRQAIEATSIELDEGAVSFSASVGLAAARTAGYDLQRLCREADAALYRAKRTGRNRVMADIENDHLLKA
ncbi:GGDEF domain-containing protein [Dyella sp. ASV21]|uniref:tetratricopeptide repeat-containing diguanylate cyclase n=1 Tax=Dyella sp. ASV21 TaxID=2795114 RepID=UPI0018EDFF53|nr:GGDEF domain-containing protein [Dyella sp. ASV21]